MVKIEEIATDKEKQANMQRLRELYAVGGGPAALARAEAAELAEQQKMVKQLMSFSGPVACTVASTPFHDKLEECPPQVEDPYEPYDLGTNATLNEQDLDLVFAALNLHDPSDVDSSELAGPPVDLTETKSRLPANEKSDVGKFGDGNFDDDDDDDDEEALLALVDQLDLDDDVLWALMGELLVAQEQDKQECVPCDTSRRRFVWD